MLTGGGADSILWTAWCSLLAFAALGCAIGWIAERTILDSVHGRIEAELAERRPGQPAADTAVT
jgi:hypothetical protein